MNAPATKTPILRTAAGEPPLGIGGLAFRDDQGEIFEHDNPRYRSPLTKVGVLELSDGRWLAHPPGFRVDAEPFATRAEAFLHAVNAAIARAIKYQATPEGEGTHWTREYSEQVIRFLRSLLPPNDVNQGSAADDASPSGHPGTEDSFLTKWTRVINAEISDPDDVKRRIALIAISRGEEVADREMVRDLVGAGLVHATATKLMLTEAGRALLDGAGEPADYEHPTSNAGMDAAGDTALAAGSPTPSRVVEQADQAGYAAIEGGADISDPIVRYLVEQHDKRKQFPAKHVFSMTTEVDDGRIVSVATCACGQLFKFGTNDYLRMNAAIEAHWSRNGDGPMVDGRGIPIKPGDAARISGSKQKVKGSPIEEGIDRGKINAEEGSARSQEKPSGRNQKRSRRSAPKAGDTPDLANAALPEPASVTLRVEDAGSSLNSDGRPKPSDAAEVPPRSEPASDVSAHLTPADAGSPVSEAGQICPTSIADPKCSACEPAQICASSPGSVDDLGSVQDALKMSTDGQPSSLGLDTNVSQRQLLNDVTAGETAPISDDDDLALDWPSYDHFLEEKIVTAPLKGIDVPRDALHPYLKPHCKDLVVWSLRLGCAAIFASFGLHKTAMQLEWCRQLVKHTGQSSLTVVPLGVRHGFIKEAVQLDMDVRFIRTSAEFDELYCEGVRHFITNYESIREGKLDPNLFEACSLDEASVLRSYGSKTFQEFLPLFSKVPFKLVATATPSPNRYKELIHYAGFLGVMDTGLALTRWFQRNSEKAGDLTLYPHKEDEFWMWVHSWAAFLQRPSELGYSDDGYELPPLKINWHEVPADHTKAEPERDGQAVMFRAVANSLQDAAKARRDSLPARIAKMVEIIGEDPASHRIIWHDLEAEREAIEQAVPSVVSITGSGMDIDTREARLHDFEEGRTQFFATKPVLSGSGSNFQYHCHKAIYVALPGYGYKFNDFIQSLYRLQRFGQQFPVEIDIIYSEDERAGRAALEEKWALDTEMRRRMSEIIKRHGLNTLPLRDALLRTMGIKRVEIRGERFIAINNDAVKECATWPENSVDLMVSSIPFGTQYEYSASYRDFGHTDDSAHFWGQMDFLSSELLRMLRPGRLACIHVKDRVLFGGVTGQGVPTIAPFHAEAIMHYRAHGFQYLGMITVVTDVVRENNQTYRLGWSENAKDGTKMGVGMPEYILLLRKPQSNLTKSYADVPVVKSKDDYTRARWQIDAHAFWRSSGNRHLTPEEFALCSSSDLAKLFAKTTVDRVYDFEAHVAIGEAIERTGTLPATFMSIAPGSHHHDVWHDVNRMRTLNMLQQRKGAEMHLCPLQFDIVDRLIERYSNPDDLVFDPFGGLMTVPYRALLKGRRGAATELSPSYFLDGVHYLHAAEEKLATPQLFDLAQFDAANTPPPGTDGGE